MVGGQAVGEEEVIGAECGADVVVLWTNVRMILIQAFDGTGTYVGEIGCFLDGAGADCESWGAS